MALTDAVGRPGANVRPVRAGGVESREPPARATDAGEERREVDVTLAWRSNSWDLPVQAEPDPEVAQHQRNVAIGHILASPAYQDPRLRELLRAVATQVTSPQALEHVAALAQHPEVLLRPDSTGTPLAENLARLATQPLNPALPADRRDRLVAAVLADLVTPDKMQQSTYGTCGAMPFASAFASSHPSEYVRLMTGLMGPEGQAKTVTGEPMRLHAEYFRSHLSGDTRSGSEIIFQSAAMDLANGSWDYSASTDKHYSHGREMGGGLTAEEQIHLGTALWGERFSKTDIQHQPPEQLAAGLGQLLQRGPVGVAFETSNGKSHMARLLKIENGQVYIDNSYSKRAAPLPGSRIEDAERSIVSFPIAEFASRALHAVTIAPEQAPTPRAPAAPASARSITPARYPTTIAG